MKLIGGLATIGVSCASRTKHAPKLVEENVTAGAGNPLSPARMVGRLAGKNEIIFYYSFSY